MKDKYNAKKSLPRIARSRHIKTKRKTNFILTGAAEAPDYFLFFAAGFQFHGDIFFFSVANQCQIDGFAYFRTADQLS